MPQEPRAGTSPSYALGQLQRALQAAAGNGDAAVRERAAAKVERWRTALDGMASGRLTVGSRTPVHDTPAWVTLEVAHGGFATGRYLAEQPLDEAEQARLRKLPQLPGQTDRERLNLWYLGDAGQAELLAALKAEKYLVDLPEHAALPVVALLIARGQHEQALDLVVELRPLLHRLRCTPRLTERAHAAGALVHLESVGSVADALRAAATPAQVQAMREALRVWNPLYDELVALWTDTVEGELPRLIEQDGGLRLAGGWPCRRFPQDWSARRANWLARYWQAVRGSRARSRHQHARSNFARLRAALEACPGDSARLSAREVGWVRRALANSVTSDGAPGSERRAALRSAQAQVAARPTRRVLAQVLAGRLDRYPAEGGLPALDPLAADVTPEELPGLTASQPVPPALAAKLERALEAPVAELVERGVIGSGEVLARVLPQVTAQYVSAGIDDPAVAALHARAYAAFRRRRSLLLLNLEQQVRFEELPWIAALQPLRREDERTEEAAHAALRHVVLLALTRFPQAILPNPLVRELGALATQAGLRLPLVQEVAADIFMGTFTTTWRRAALIASDTLAGTLYARYYDLPPARQWQQAQAAPANSLRGRLRRRWGRETAEDFAALCRERAAEAGHRGSGYHVAENGAVLEQSQILTTHNLAVLTSGLSLQPQLQGLAPELCEQVLRWIVRQHERLPAEHHPALQAVKNIAYGWRQAVFLLSYCPAQEQQAVLDRLVEQTSAPAGSALRPAVAGLAHVLGGGRFDAGGSVPGSTARRLLGWSVGPHWLLDRP